MLRPTERAPDWSFSRWMSEHFTLQISLGCIRMLCFVLFLFQQLHTERIQAHPGANSVFPAPRVIWTPFPVAGSALCQEGHGLKREKWAGTMPTGDGRRMNYFEARLRFLRLGAESAIVSIWKTWQSSRCEKNESILS